MKSAIKSLTDAVVVGINWALREKSRAELYRQVHVKPFVNYTTHFGLSETEIKIRFPKPSLLRIDIKNVDGVNFPKEDAEAFWKRMEKHYK